MTQLYVYTTVNCPFEDVPERLTRFFGGDTAVVPLRMRFADLRIERDVEIHLASKPGYPGYRLVDVSWAPRGGGPYPVFHGTLSIQDEGAGWSRIDLDGTYQPPFGLVGAAIDAAVGHRVASATASDFLAELKRIITSDRTAATA